MSYHAVDSHEDATSFFGDSHLTKRHKHLLLAGCIVTSGIILYCLCFLLPLMFIPKPCDIHEIAQLKSLDIILNPVLSKVALPWTSFDELDHDSGHADIEYLEEITSGTKKDRLIVVGDIHGQQKELHKLLKKISFNKKSDTLLVLGDFISKGPRSLEVIDDLIELGAKCILGNHEYYVLQRYAAFHGLTAPSFERGFFKGDSTRKSMSLDTESNFNDDPEFLLAKKLQPQHVKYINLCPVMMLMGHVPLHSSHNNGKGRSGQGLAVHAGLRWDLTQSLEEQDPLGCLEMRAYIGPHFNETTDDSGKENAISWSKIWNLKHKEGISEDDYVVYYGHDAHRGLNIKRWAKGMDTGCAKGGALSAMLIWQEKSINGGLVYKENVVSVKC
ncbi:Metallo-dependent phosphatase [Metschnikowia bicuspidata var. bicuspidata NRRL YB-4993]|uniref:Metallo-dependent phosphatase n=1 Tax=Metschnikowia bicuspidata var. bicuspidata NRRL YB-4993 TaxID=869754 RepID=A0A1A0H9M2_9ASCO|nr:Metallo-dependent phosphatase [Metschnikowia bicuspidata var. bicuspidata NRRL YB-4993]OBA20578.1 Metallo-dependent phosphatase [Metschnikowia bicuspidata var. bicuspidata NRRL YB-4993]